MAHNIDISNNRANIAFIGSRNDIWHRLGNEMQPGQSIEVWAKEAGLDWEAIKVPAFFCHAGEMIEVEGHKHIIRNDTKHALGYATDRYQPVQPIETLKWLDKYISVDDRFQLDVAGSLKQGEIIWATATFNGGITVAGDNHIARLLMTTTFDGTGATINKGTMTRVVCNNTLDAALADGGKAVIKTRHSTKFNSQRVSADLADIAKSFMAYKAMGDAMAMVHLTKDQVSMFFKKVLGIDPAAKEDKISTRKFNQFRGLTSAYKETIAEGTEAGTGWCALNAVTRFVDHDRETRGGNSVDEARFLSSQFGSGALIKSNAVQMLKELCNVD